MDRGGHDDLEVGSGDAPSLHRSTTVARAAEARKRPNGCFSASYTLAMEFRVLGPLEVLSEGRLLDLGGAKQRALLAMLLLDANSVVSTSRLIEALWEDDPPDTAQKALQVHVSGLRKVVGKERVVTREPGYLLRVEEDELDVTRFQRLREQGKPADALALWRGDPLSEFTLRRFAQSDIARLEDARLGCIEERIDLDLRSGRHAELTGELESLVNEHPLRERLRALLMLALYRSGRQAEALAAYQHARNALVEELGIEPGKALRDLHQAVLTQDPALDLPGEEVPAPGFERRDRPTTLPTGTVTLLFADVEGSTRLLYALGGERYQEMRTPDARARPCRSRATPWRRGGPDRRQRFHRLRGCGRRGGGCRRDPAFAAQGVVDSRRGSAASHRHSHGRARAHGRRLCRHRRAYRSDDSALPHTVGR